MLINGHLTLSTFLLNKYDNSEKSLTSIDEAEELIEEAISMDSKLTETNVE